MIRRAGTATATLLLAALVGGGCEGAPRPAPEESAPQEGVVPHPGLDPVLPDPILEDGTEPPARPGLPDVGADTVRGWTGPGGRAFEVTLRTRGDVSHLNRQIGRRTFPLPARQGNPVLTQYPCASCHAGAEAGPGTAEEAHRHIRPVHPSATGAVCSTCHVSDSVERLVVPESAGGSVSLDHAYRLCAGCHSSETESWAAGIHGKRLEAWTGRRVVMNCADCHDPHRPALEPRIPFPGPRLPARARGVP